MSLRAYVSLLLVVAALSFERTAYYVARTSVFAHFVSSLGMSSGRAGSLYWLTTGLTFVATLAGGGLAFAIGPRATAALGALVATAGAAMLALGVTPYAGVAVFAVGSGLFRPCPWAAAAETIANEDRGPDGLLAPSPRRFAIVAAVFVVMHVAVNAGAGVAPIVSGVLSRARGTPAVFGVSAALYAFAFLLSGAAAVVALLRPAGRVVGDVGGAPYRGGPMVAAERDDVGAPRAKSGVALLAIPTLLTAAAMSLSYPASGAALRSWTLSLNPIVVIAVSVGLFVLWVAAAVGRWSLAPLVVWGAGLAVFGLGLFPASFATRHVDNVALFASSAVLMAIGEAAMAPLGLAYAALSARRGSTLAVALFAGVTGYVGSLASGALGTGIEAPLLGLLGMSALAAGIAAVVLGARMHRAYFERAPGPRL